MSYRTSSSNQSYVYGSVAISQPSRPRLVLIEGTSEADRRRAAEDERARKEFEAGRLSTLQLVSVIAAALAFFILLGFVAANLDAKREGWVSEATQAVSTESVTVVSGDSLWGIAEEHGIEGLSTDQVVDFIESRNSLDSATIHVGQTIEVPASSSN